MNPSSGGKKKSVDAAFNRSLNIVKIAEDEFHAHLDSARHPKRPGGSRSRFSLCVQAAVQNVFDKLRHSEDYVPIFLTDDVMGIEAFAEQTRDNFMNNVTRAKYRLKFRDELAYGIQNMTINVFGKLNAGRDAHCLFVWKVPSVYGALHAGRVAKVIDDCREMLPKKISAEVERQFNAMMDGIADLPAKARDALRNLLFIGDPNPDNSVADKYVDFVCNLVSEGGTLDELMLVDGRANNSRGGNGFDASRFDEFWKACKEVLMPDARAEERRHSSVMHASEAHSIPDLVSQATAVLQEKVNDGKLEKMPLIPSHEWVRCQFVPNNTQRDAASVFTGKLDIKRGVQVRSLRKKHEDEHWVRAHIRYFKEWMVELRQQYDGIEFFGQDDKAKIPIGDEVSLQSFLVVIFLRTYS